MITIKPYKLPTEAESEEIQRKRMDDVYLNRLENNHLSDTK